MIFSYFGMKTMLAGVFTLGAWVYLPPLGICAIGAYKAHRNYEQFVGHRNKELHIWS